MKVKQFVMAYSADHDRIRSLLGPGYTSLRPVLRINVEIIGDGEDTEAQAAETKESAEQAESTEGRMRIEFNTPVAAYGKRGWLNLALWESPETKITWRTEDKHVGEKTKGSDTAVKGLTTVFRTDFLTIEFTGVGLGGGCPAEKDNDGCFYLAGPSANFVHAEKIDASKEYCDCAFTWTDPQMEAMKIPREEILGAYQVVFER